MNKKSGKNQNANISKTKKDEIEQLKRLEKSPDHGTKVSNEHVTANPNNPRIQKMEKELIQRRTKAPENKGAKIKIHPQKEKSDPKRVAKDEAELLKRRRDSPQNKQQGSNRMKKNMKNSKTCYCKSCNCEIPISSASTREGQDYVYYFCGDKCLKKWEQSKKKK